MPNSKLSSSQSHLCSIINIIHFVITLTMSVWERDSSDSTRLVKVLFLLRARQLYTGTCITLRISGNAICTL